MEYRRGGQTMSVITNMYSNVGWVVESRRGGQSI